MTALAQAVVTGNTSAGTNTVVTATLGSTPTPGNLLIAVVGAGNPAVTAAPWGATVDLLSNLAGTARVAFYSKVAGASEPTTVSATLSATATTHRITVYEFSPTAGFAWSGVDKTAQAQDAGVSVATLTSGTTAATTSAEGVAVAGFTLNGTPGTSLTFTNGYTATQNGNGATGHLILTATGTQESTASWTTVRRVAGGIVAYKQTASTGNTGAGFLALLSR